MKVCLMFDVIVVSVGLVVMVSGRYKGSGVVVCKLWVDVMYDNVMWLGLEYVNMYKEIF